MQTILFTSTIILSLFLTSCSSPVYLTQSTRERIQKTNVNNIEKIQFFNDRKIVIVHKTDTRDEKIKGGKVVFEDGFFYYFITIPKNTPAVASYENDEKIKVFFEEGEDQYIIFGKYSDNRYGLYGVQKEDGFYLDYEGKSFKLNEGTGVRLTIKKNTNIDVNNNKRKAKGVKIK